MTRLKRISLHRRCPELCLELVAYFVCLSSPLLFLGWPLFTGRVLITGDILAQYWPYRDLWAAYIRNGTLPLWNPYVFAGMPFLGDPQFAALHPLNLVFLLFPSLTAIQIYGLAAYALLAAFTYFYIRTLHRSRLAGLVAALSLAFGLFMVVHWSHITIVHCILWLPLQLALIERLAATRQARYMLLLAVALALQIYSGHPQFLFYSWLVMGAYQIGHLVMARHNRRELIGLLGIATLAGILLGSLQLLPSMELARSSSRQMMSYEEFGDYSLRPVLLLQLITPFLFGAPARFLYTTQPFAPGWDFETIAYAGALSIVCLVSVFALRRWGGWRETFWWLILAWGLVFALGKYTPLYRVVYHIPVYNLFRVAGRHLFPASLALAMITGLRLDVLLQASRRVIAGTLGGFLVLAVLMIAYAWSQGGAALRAHYRHDWLRPELLLPLLTFALLFLVLWPFGDGSHRQRWPGRVLLLGLVACDLFLTSSTLAPAGSREQAIDQESEFQRLAAVLLHDGERLWHLPPRPTNNYLFAPLPSATSYNPLIIRRYAQLAHFQSVLPASALWKIAPDARESLLDLLHVGYLLMPQEVARQPWLDPDCEQQIEGFCFTNLRDRLYLRPGEQALLPLPDLPELQIGVVSALGYSVDVPNDTPVAQVSFLDRDHTALSSAPLLAGSHTAEWAADCLPAGQSPQHDVPSPAYSWTALDQRGNPCRGHAYFSAFSMEPGRRPAFVQFQNTSNHSSFLLYGLSFSSEGQAWECHLQAGLYRALVPPADPDWTTDRWAIYRRPPAWGHAWPVESIRVMTDTTFLQAFYAPRQHPLDLGRIAYVDAADMSNYLQTWPDLQDARFDAQAQVTNLRPYSLTLQVRADAPALIVLSEIYYPGWLALVDGQESQILRVDHALRAVIVPAGIHTVRLVYRPRSVLWGVVLCVAALGLTAVYAGQATIRRRSAGRGLRRAT